MAFTPLADLAAMAGMPVWFIGGLLGLAVFWAILGLSMKFLKARGVLVPMIGVGLCFANWMVFAWPLWMGITAAVGFVWAVNRGG